MTPMAKILLVEPNYIAKFKPLGLMRISSYHKARGDEVVFAKGEKLIDFIPDRIYITTLFTYRYKEVIRTIRFYKERYKEANILVGGVLASLMPDLIRKEGVTVHIGLLQAVEDYPPDYSLFPDIDYSLTTTTRGCANKCGFCVVPRIEPSFFNRDWVKDINPKFKTIIFMDNNWLVKTKENWLADIAQLRELKEKGVTRIDFNQSLDCRLITEWHYKQMKGLPISPLRFSFDHLGQDKHIQKAIRLAMKYKFIEIRVDVLYNWQDTIEDFYYRLKEVAKAGASSIPMRYAPIFQTDRQYVGQHWTAREVKGVTRMNPFKGQISTRNIKDFEYFFGRNAKQFKRLLNYRDISKLTDLKLRKFRRDKLCKIK